MHTFICTIIQTGHTPRRLPGRAVPTLPLFGGVQSLLASPSHGSWRCTSWMCACAAPCKPRCPLREIPRETPDTHSGSLWLFLAAGPLFPWSHSGERMFSTVWAGGCCHTLTSGNTRLGLNYCFVTLTLIFILMTVASAPGRFYFHLHMTSLVFKVKCFILCISVLLMEWPSYSFVYLIVYF